MDFLQRYGWKNLLLWTCVGVLDFAGDYFNDLLWDRTFYWKEEIPFVTSWYTWFLLTPIAATFAHKWKYAYMHTWRFAGLHLLCYLLINCIQIILASLHIQFVARTLLELQPFTGILYKTAISGTFYNFVVYGIILLTINLIHNYRQLRDEQSRSMQLKKEMAETRLQYLYQQLQPHFLFNTHHSIITLFKMGEHKKGLMMMEKLSALMRETLKEKTKQEQQLSKELLMIEQYLGIQKIRFEYRLEYHIEMSDKEKAALVPTMILQPIIENSIRHTLEGSTQKALIKIRAWREKDSLHLSVRDNGDDGTHIKGFGVGLENTRNRLSALYGNDFSFDIHKHTVEFPGTEVLIKIPLRYE